MGRRGPPPKPTHLKVVQGNPGKRPLNADEPKPKPVRPEKPKMSGEPSKVYDQLADVTESMGVLTEADGVALELAADAITDYRKARARARKKPSDWRLHVRQEKARAQALVLLREFGWTPASRTRLRTEKQSSDDEFEDFLRRGDAR